MANVSKDSLPLKAWAALFWITTLNKEDLRYNHRHLELYKQTLSYLLSAHNELFHVS